jgi:hypothetical protein
MTKVQILWNLGLGLVLFVVGLVLSPLLTRMWAWMNKPRPLTPQDKGALVAQVGMLEAEQAKLNHYKAHPKDIFLLLIQLALIDVLVGASAVGTFHFYPFREDGNPNPLGVVMVVFVLLISFVIFYLTHRLSDKNIDTQITNVLYRIDEAKRKLNAPTNP